MLKLKESHLTLERCATLGWRLKINQSPYPHFTLHRVHYRNTMGDHRYRDHRRIRNESRVQQGSDDGSSVQN